MGYILKYKLWESKIHERSNPILEQETSGFAAEAATVDTEAVKARPAYNDVINWWAGDRPRKLYSKGTKEEVEQSKVYWLGDLSSKTRGSNVRAKDMLDIISDEGNVEKLIKKLGAYSSDKVTSTQKKKYEIYNTIEDRFKNSGYEIAKITDAASQIKNALSELNASGKSIGGRQAAEEKGGTEHEYRLGSGKSSYYLNILPFQASKKEYYVGKDVSTRQLKTFNKWYDQISKDGGIAELIDKINNKEYWKKEATYAKLKPQDKIKILDGIYEKANGYRTPKNISDATKIVISPKKSTWEKKEEPTDWVTDSARAGFPEDMQKDGKNFMVDDGIDIKEEYKEEFRIWLATTLLKIEAAGGKDITVAVRAVASTSKVPSTLFHNRDGNVGLVNARLAEMKRFVSESLVTGKMPAAIYAEEASPDNELSPEWDDAARSLYPKKTLADGTTGRGEEYEKLYSPTRFSGFEIDIAWKTQSRDIVTTVEEIGEWKFGLAWGHYTKPPGGGQPGRKLKNKPFKIYDGSCPNESWGSYSGFLTGGAVNP